MILREDLFYNHLPSNCYENIYLSKLKYIVSTNWILKLRCIGKSIGSFHQLAITKMLRKWLFFCKCCYAKVNKNGHLCIKASKLVIILHWNTRYPAHCMIITITTFQMVQRNDHSNFLWWTYCIQYWQMLDAYSAHETF